MPSTARNPVYAPTMPYRLTLFDDQDGRAVGGGTFDTPEQAGLAAMTSQKDLLARGCELWPSVVHIDESGRAQALDRLEKAAFQRGMDQGMDELMASSAGELQGQRHRSALWSRRRGPV